MISNDPAGHSHHKPPTRLLQLALAKAAFRAVSTASLTVREEISRSTLHAAGDVVLRAQSLRSFTVSAAAGPALRIVAGRDAVGGVREIITALQRHRPTRALLFRAVARQPSATLLAAVLVRVERSDDRVDADESAVLAPVSIEMFAAALGHLSLADQVNQAAIIRAIVASVEKSPISARFFAAASSLQLLNNGLRPAWLRRLHTYVLARADNRIPRWVAPLTPAAASALRFCRTQDGAASDESVTARALQELVEVLQRCSPEQWRDVGPVLASSALFATVVSYIAQCTPFDPQSDPAAVAAAGGIASLAALVSQQTPTHPTESEEAVLHLRESVRLRTAATDFADASRVKAFGGIAGWMTLAAHRVLWFHHVAVQLRRMGPYAEAADDVGRLFVLDMSDEEPQQREQEGASRSPAARPPAVALLHPADSAPRDHRLGAVWAAAVWCVAALVRVPDWLQSGGREAEGLRWGYAGMSFAIEVCHAALAHNGPPSAAPLAAMISLIETASVAGDCVTYFARQLVLMVHGVSGWHPAVRKRLRGLLQACVTSCSRSVATAVQTVLKQLA
jgi:hypothetical protein